MPDTTDEQLIEGGKAVKLDFRNGNTERVIVRELPIRQLPKMLDLQDDEPALVELYCDKEESWADGLTTAAHEKVLEEGAALNFPILERWIERKAGAVEKLSPMLQKVQKLGNSLPTSAPAQG